MGDNDGYGGGGPVEGRIGVRRLFTFDCQDRAMKVLACYAVKGGVGKTAAAVNLAWLAARDGNRTLLWDLDAQSAATFLLRGKPKVKGGTRKLLQGDSDVERAIRSTSDDRLDLLPADPSYWTADLDLSEVKRRENRVAKVIKAVADDYDLAVLDAPAGLSLLSMNIVTAADLVLAPIVPSPLSLRTLDQVVDLAATVERQPAVMAFLSMVERRRALHRDVVELLHGRYADVARTVIPSSAIVERMGQRRRPVVATAPTSPVGAAYAGLWHEVAARLGVGGAGQQTL
ncbi:MAG: ParA family protein [Frankiaceae bacterium]|nr:ParA family protein [Frankiaceae bacterium]